MSAQQKRLLRFAGFAIALNAILVWILSSIAPQTDYQFTFLGMVAATSVTVLAVLLLLHRVAVLSNRRWLVPVTAGLVALATVATFRVESLSGDLIPKIVLRWSSREIPKLQRAQQISTPAKSKTTAKADTQIETATPVESGSVNGNPTESDSSGETLSAGWAEFLGPHRDGSIDQRNFEIPSDPSQVKTRWSIGIGSGWSSFSVGRDASGTMLAVTLEQRAQTECVTAYRLSDGELVWMVEHESFHTHPLGGDGPRSTPTIDGGRVYAQGARGMVWCLDLTTGEKIWTKDLLEIAGWTIVESELAVLWGRSGSPLIIDDLCVLPLGGPTPTEPTESDAPAVQRSLIAFDKSTGEIRWRAGEDQISYASAQPMTIDGQQQIVIVNEITITGHRPDSGEQLWSFPWIGQSNGGANCTSVIPIAEDKFWIGKGYGGGSAVVQIDQKESMKWSADPVWQSARVLKTKFNHAVVRDGVAYALSNGALEAVDLTTGEQLWIQPRRERSGQGQVLLAEDVLIVQNEMGEVLFVEANPKEYIVRCRVDALQNKTWNIPTLVDNILLVRNAEQAIAFELPNRP